MMLENILADFELLDDWEDRYRYVIELGRSLPPDAVPFLVVTS
jgi:cysteine desulfuration protein SufE